MTTFVPDDFDVPAGLTTSRLRLEPLGVEHNAADHAAWSSSIAHIRSTPGFPDGSWPSPMSLERNGEDLQRHRDDFTARRSFTYTVLDPSGDVIGCVYIDPSDDTDADVSSWVRADVAELDPVLFEEVTAWLHDAWPFERVAYAPRPPRGG